METARFRILKFIENQCIDPNSFLKRTGLKRGFIDKSHVKSGMSDIFLSKILDNYPEISPEWLLTGKGSMLKEDKEHVPSTNEDPARVNEEATIYNKDQTSKELVTERNLTNIKERILYYTDYKRLPKEIFFKNIGTTYGNFKGKAKEQALGSDIIERIISIYTDLNPEWLLTGKGSMLKEEKGHAPSTNEDPLCVNEEAAIYNKAQVSKDLANEIHLLKEENKALMQDKMAIMQDKITIMQDNSTLKDNTMLLMNEKIELKEENISLKYKVKELEAQNNTLSEEITLLKKAQQYSTTNIQENKPKLATEKQS